MHSEIKVKVKDNLVGKKFNRLTVVGRANDYIYPNGKRRLACWLCICDCGNQCIVRGTALKNNNTRSCGCLQKEKSAAANVANKKYNDYDLSGEYGIGYTLNTNKEFYFDLEDYDKIKNYCWHEGTGGYIRTWVNDGYLVMHRLIMLNENDLHNKSIDVDHKHGHATRNDNRKCNLRVATRQENLRNKTLMSTNKSGFIGVSFRKNSNKWRAYINVDKDSQRSLGHYETFTEAVKARIEGELKYFNDFAYSSHKNVLKYINEGGTLEPYNRAQIESIMNSK